jgi:hypothetical protein
MNIKEKRELLIDFYTFLVCEQRFLETNPFDPTIFPDKFLKTIKKCTHAFYKNDFNSCDWHDCNNCDYFK